MSSPIAIPSANTSANNSQSAHSPRSLGGNANGLYVPVHRRGGSASSISSISSSSFLEGGSLSPIARPVHGRTRSVSPMPRAPRSPRAFSNRHLGTSRARSLHPDSEADQGRASNRRFPVFLASRDAYTPRIDDTQHIHHLSTPRAFVRARALLTAPAGTDRRPHTLHDAQTQVLCSFLCSSIFFARVLITRLRDRGAPNRTCARTEVESGRAEDAPSAPRPQELGREAARRARARHRRRGTPPPLRHELGLDRTRRQWRRVRAGELAVACGHRRGMRDGESIC